jgi:hypothetical protein
LLVVGSVLDTGWWRSVVRFQHGWYERPAVRGCGRGSLAYSEHFRVRTVHFTLYVDIFRVHKVISGYEF